MRKAVVLLGLVGCSGVGPPPPETPGIELVGVLHDEHALRRPHDVALQGDMAFVPGKGGSLALIDISDPSRPRLLSAIVDPVKIEDAETVLPLGDILLLGARDLHAVDVSDPQAPKILKTISDRPRIDKINGMVKVGRYVFSANKTGFVTVFDVSEPRNPRLADVLDARAHGQDRPHDIASYGEERIVVVDASRDSEAAVRVYRVLEEGRLLPSEQWEAEGRVVAGTESRLDLGGANRVHVEGTHAYVGAYVPDRVAIVDLSDPSDIFQRANLPVCDIGATGLTLVGRALFVAGGECVEAIDVSDPTHLVSVAQYRNGELFPSREIQLDGVPRYDNGHDLVYRDGYLYVTAQNNARFGVLKVNEPAVLRLAEDRNQP